MNAAQVARIIIENSSVLSQDATRNSFKIVPSGDGYALQEQRFTPGRAGRTQDEIDDDIDGPGYVRLSKRIGAFSSYVEAATVKNSLIDMINLCRSKEVPYEEALAISCQDLQPGYGEGRNFGFHDLGH